MRPCLSQSLTCDRRWEVLDGARSLCGPVLHALPAASHPTPTGKEAARGGLWSGLQGTGCSGKREKAVLVSSLLPTLRVSGRELGVPLVQHFTTPVARSRRPVRCYLKNDFSCEKCWEAPHHTCASRRGTWARFPVVWKDHNIFPL